MVKCTDKKNFELIQMAARDLQITFPGVLSRSKDQTSKT